MYCTGAVDHHYKSLRRVASRRLPTYDTTTTSTRTISLLLHAASIVRIVHSLADPERHRHCSVGIELDRRALMRSHAHSRSALVRSFARSVEPQPLTDVTSLFSPSQLEQYGAYKAKVKIGEVLGGANGGDGEQKDG